MRIRTFLFAVLFTVLACIPLLAAGKPQPVPKRKAVKQAIKAYDAGKPKEVKALLEPMVKAGQASEIAYFYLGMVAYDKGDLATAEKYDRKAVSINPDYAAPYSDLAAILIQKGKYQEAIPLARKATELDPSNAEAFANLGMAQLSLKQDEAAYQSFLASARVDPNAIARSGAQMLIQYHDPKSALYYLNIALKVAPDDSLALLNAGQAYRMLHDQKSALDVLKRGYEVTPVKADVFGVIYSSYFRVLLDTGHYREILKTATEKVGTDYASAEYFLALASYQLGQTAEFRKAATRYFKLSKDKEPASLDQWARKALAGPQREKSPSK